MRVVVIKFLILCFLSLFVYNYMNISFSWSVGNHFFFFSGKKLCRRFIYLAFINFQILFTVFSAISFPFFLGIRFLCRQRSLRAQSMTPILTRNFQRNLTIKNTFGRMRSQIALCRPKTAEKPNSFLGGNFFQTSLSVLQGARALHCNSSNHPLLHPQEIQQTVA